MSKQRLELTWYNKDMALIPTETGKYGYRWVDPADPRYCETHTLILDQYVQGRRSEKSEQYQYSVRADLEPQTDNMLILGESGDVLEALTRVPELAEKYVGKVKLIYIDPPFNTAKTFDSYEDNLEHSIWLTMMRDRLVHLKSLLRNDGFLFVHLDNGEIHRMRLLLDEILGTGCFVSEIDWEKTFKPRNDADMISGRHDVILVYKKSNSAVFNKLERTTEMNKSYSNPDNDHRGSWTSAPITAPGAKTHQGMVYAIQHPITGDLIYPSRGRCWTFGQSQMLEIMRGWNPGYELIQLDDKKERAEVCGLSLDEVKEGVCSISIRGFTSIPGEKVLKRGNWPLIYLTGNGMGGFRRKTYLSDMEARAIEDLWFQDEVGSNDSAKNEIKALFPGDAPFATPKPEKLLERIIHIATNPGDIVLDCFAGSGTTAAVAQKMGRRWVTCELLKSNFYTYDLPRLTKVVNGEDAGGISQAEGERIPGEGVELPDGVSAEDAAKFNQVLNKLIADDADMKKNSVIKALKAKSKTRRTKSMINWRGGGGFQVAHVGPQCFDFDEKMGRVLLTPAATGETLVRSVAANLGFHLLPVDHDFDGVKGKTFLKVIEGVATVDTVDWLVSHIGENHTITIAALSVMDGVREHLRRTCKGSRIIIVPDDVFHYTKGDEE